MELDQLITELADADPAKRATAAEELARLTEGAQTAAVPLVKAMSDADGTVRDWAHAALESLGPPHAEDADELISLLSDAKLNIAYWAATLLGRLGADGDPAKTVPALVEAFTKHPDLAVRERAAWALGRIGPPAAAALPVLRGVAGDGKVRLSRLASEAIENRVNTVEAVNNIAFKEWAAVCAALAAGRQSIVLRKGGIDEGRDGFRIQHREFWLLPTRFHQDASQLAPGSETFWRQSQVHQPPAGEFRIELYAAVEEVFEVASLAVLERLLGEHILSKDTVEQRFHYRRPGLFVLAVRVYRAPSVFEVGDSPYIAGCKSWVDLPHSFSTTGLQPVLEDREFAVQLARIDQLLNDE